MKPPAFKVELPDAERGRSADEIARLDVLNARLSRPPKARGRMSAEKARDADLEERNALEARPVLKADNDWAKTTADETERLALGRGEEVEKRTASGRVVIASRDQLLALLRAGNLTADQYDTAIAVRDLFEQRTAALGSQMGGLGSVKSPTYDNSSAVFYAYQAAAALQKLGNIERAILVGGYRLRDGTYSTVERWAEMFKAPAAPPTHVALQMLKWVCDQNGSLRAFGAGNTYYRNVKALALALDVADCVLRGK
jgi:hypothetical protein